MIGGFLTKRTIGGLTETKIKISNTTNMELKNTKISPHGEGLERLNDEQEDAHLKQLDNWNINRKNEQHILNKTFQFNSFNESINFTNKIAELANKENHHPNILIYFKKVILELTTHHVQGLTLNDFIMAVKIDEI